MGSGTDAACIFISNPAVRHDRICGGIRKSYPNQSSAAGRSDGVLRLEYRTDYQFPCAELPLLQPVARAVSFEHAAEPNDGILRLKRDFRYLVGASADS